MARILTSHHQRQRVATLFDHHPIDILDMRQRMTGVLPRNLGVDIDSKEDSAITQDTLRNAILNGGSLAFNALKHTLSGDPRIQLKPLPHLVKVLTHDVKELYRWAWIWSERGEQDGSILDQCKSWFTDIQEAIADGKSHPPKYHTFDGPGAPHAKLCIESVCPCHVHAPLSLAVAKPCRCHKQDKTTMTNHSSTTACHTTAAPVIGQKRRRSADSADNVLCFQQLANESPDSGVCLEDGYLLLIDGLTIHKSDAVESQSGAAPPHFTYTMLETGKVFTSPLPDILLAYKQEKNKFQKFKRQPFKKARK